MAFPWFGGHRLLLAGTRLGWFWVAAGVVALGLLWVLYREERRLVSRRAGLGLLALRLAAALVLVVALFEPIAARTYREVVKGRLLVAVDVSESMTTADPGRLPEDRARLARELKLSPGEPVERLSRREVARRLVDGMESPVGQLAKEHAVEGLAFARDTAPATLAALAETLRRPLKADDPAALTTDWQPVLAEALKESGAPVVGVVLLTDGRQNAPGDPVPTLDRLSARGIPVFPVMVGATAPPRDAAIAALKAPESVYKGDTATVEATLKLDGFAGREVAVMLERPGASPLRQTVVAPADGSRPSVTFRVPMNEAGSVPLTVALAPLEGDVRPDNDRSAVTIQVADDQAAVLLVDGEARWEFRYLRNALTRDPRVAAEAVVFRQPEASGISSQLAYGALLPARPEPAGSLPDPLGAFDAIVVGDVDPADLPAESWARLESYVAERGGTLVLSPGPKFWATTLGIEPARALWPVLEPRPVPVDPGSSDPAHPSLPPGTAVLPTTQVISDAGTWPMFQLAASLEENRARWAGLPRLPWVLAGRAKPGATVLATTDDASAAAIAAQPYGLGKVLWIGTDATWRWRYRVGDAYHHRFWGQVVRWASAGKLAAGNALVRFGPLRPKVAEREGAVLQARIAEGVAGVSPDLLIAARVFKADPATREAVGEAVAVVPLRTAAGRPRTFEGTAPGLPQGAYVVRLDVPQLADALHLDRQEDAPRAPLEVTARATSERVELAAARDPLDRLAAATGGRALADFEADTLPSLIRSRTRTTVRNEETPLWDHPGALLLFLAILTIEWVARKRVGLP